MTHITFRTITRIDRITVELCSTDGQWVTERERRRPLVIDRERLTEKDRKKERVREREGERKRERECSKAFWMK